MVVKRRRFPKDDSQGDLFAVDARALYAVETPKGVITGSDFRVRMAQAISEALYECGRSRREIAREMREMLADDAMSEHMLNAYASPARDTHDIPMTRLRALVQATGQAWLLNVATEGLGVVVLASEDAYYAQIGAMTRSKQLLEERIEAASRLAPISPRTTQRGRR